MRPDLQVGSATREDEQKTENLPKCPRNGISRKTRASVCWLLFHRCCCGVQPPPPLASPVPLPPRNKRQLPRTASSAPTAALRCLSHVDRATAGTDGLDTRQFVLFVTLLQFDTCPLVRVDQKQVSTKSVENCRTHFGFGLAVNDEMMLQENVPDASKLIE